MNVVKQWLDRYLSDPQVVILSLLLLAGFAVVLSTGDILTPFFAAVIIAYLLEGWVAKLESWHVSRWLGATLMFVVFLVLMLLFFLVLVPILSRQLTQVIAQVPDMLQQLQMWVLGLPERYPTLFTDKQVNKILAAATEELRVDSEAFLTQSIKIGVGATYIMLYLALVPFMVFFMLKDKVQINAWLRQFVPQDSTLATSVWNEVDDQIGNYVRGKAIEITVIGSISMVTFRLLGLDYATLLGVIVGLSVIIPYVGATFVTIPVLAVAYLDPSASFVGVSIAYFVIQILDGNVLVPILFSEVVDIHPVGIIVAILLFGGIWGFWGVFFAIPLATLVQAVIRAWPRKPRQEPESLLTKGPIMAER